MAEETGGERGRWGTAVALFAAVVVLSALDAVPLVTLPLAVLLLAVPYAPRWRWLAMGTFLWLFGFSFPGTELGGLSRGWALLLGGAFLAATMRRPQWGVFPRALAALAVAMVAAAAWVSAAADWRGLDTRVREHLLSVANTAMERLGEGSESSPWMAQLAESAREFALLQWELFPALVALQSLAAVALACWTVTRLQRGARTPFGLRPLREFRFNDQLVWVVIAGLLLVVLPLSALATRVGWNALLFMGGLYALRGFGIFVFLAGGAPSLAGVVFGALALLFIYPLVLTTAVLVGLVDTWLDLRARASASATPRS